MKDEDICPVFVYSFLNFIRICDFSEFEYLTLYIQIVAEHKSYGCEDPAYWIAHKE